jgi:ABC-type nitrate/sulfonate/bicarbonate transport system ATPase subunit
MNMDTKSQTAAPPALEIQAVNLSFRERRQSLAVLNQISLTVPTGKFVSIIGPSGCGKSTLFHVIGGLTKPDSGKVLMHGKDITGERGHISYVPQKPALFPWRSTLDNVVLAREIAGMPIKAAREEAREWLTKAGLNEFEQAYPHKLSGGMQQRASFLRGLLAPQEVLCLDEPFSALDALTRTDMQRWLLDIWEENQRTVLMITHSVEEALMLSDTIYLFSNRPAAVLHKIDVPFARPRSEILSDDPRFLELKREIGAQMRTQMHTKTAGIK